ncbi:MAG: phosphorylase family protein [Planctomycetota bacterium]|jgi:hypothetical protein
MTVKPVIVCPLEIERRALRRAGLATRWQLECCGPGTQNVEAWARQARTRCEPGATVILAGLAGGLSLDQVNGSAWTVGVVLDLRTGERWRAPHCDSTCVVVTVDTAVTTIEQKERLRDRTAADLVDLESAPFARAADDAGWTWRIVRGVSDDLETPLPPETERWISRDGRVRHVALLTSLLRRPHLVARMPGMARRSRAAMTSVAGQLSQEAPRGERS